MSDQEIQNEQEKKQIGGIFVLLFFVFLLVGIVFLKWLYF